MTDTEVDSYRWERIERLMRELEYELVRGMMEREIPETIGFEFFVPVSHSLPNGLVQCRFETRPVQRGYYTPSLDKPKLRVVE